MTTYTIVNKSDNNNIIAIFTDREVAIKMMRVYKECLKGADIYCSQRQVFDKVPAWAERILENM